MSIKIQGGLGIVYLIENLVNGKKYVGKTTLSLKRRWISHKADARRGSRHPIHRAIRWYSPQNFFIKIIARCNSPEELNATERKFIAELETHTSRGKGYNATWGGDGCGSGEEHPSFGKPVPEERRKKISEGHKRIVHPSHKQRGLFHWNRGLVRSKETRGKIREKRALQDMSYKFRSMCKLGHPRTPENLTSNRTCKTCRKLQRPPYDPKYWHAVYLKQKARKAGLR